MENLVARPLEEALSSAPGVERISSSSSEGYASIRVEFAHNVNLDEAANELRSRIDRRRSTLPEDMPPPVMYKFDVSQYPIMFLTVAAKDLDAKDLRRFVEKQIQYRLERVPGVAQFTVRGRLAARDTRGSRPGAAAGAADLGFRCNQRGAAGEFEPPGGAGAGRQVRRAAAHAGRIQNTGRHSQPGGGDAEPRASAFARCRDGGRLARANHATGERERRAGGAAVRLQAIGRKHGGCKRCGVAGGGEDPQ